MVGILLKHGGYGAKVMSLRFLYQAIPKMLRYISMAFWFQANESTLMFLFIVGKKKYHNWM
ncbi:hypothetical protein EPX27_19900 [Escherichia coli]|nr:hypothetical protein [Escherichia coli]EEX8204737.1 hypothetical protein [Escherichia coli]